MSKEEILGRIEELSMLLSLTPESEALLLERGNLYWKLQDWQLAMQDYDAAIAINPDGQAVELRNMARQIISFYHKDRYNP